MTEVFCNVCGRMHYMPMCHPKGGSSSQGGFHAPAPDLISLNPIDATSNLSFSLSVGRGKCPNCRIETKVSKYSGEVYNGNCPKCGNFQTLKVWEIK